VLESTPGKKNRRQTNLTTKRITISID